MARAALVVSILALLGAWGGPALADHLLTGRQIKDRSLTGRDMKSNSVTGRVVSGLSGRDIAPDSIDGSDVAEETLDVRRARSAETADSLAGVRLARVHARLLPGGEAVALDLGGLKLTATCSATSALALRATTTEAGSLIRAGAVTRSGGNAPTTAFLKDDEFDPGEEFDAAAGAPDNSLVHLTYAAASGATVTATLLAEQGLPPSRGFTCLVAGTATHAAG